MGNFFLFAVLILSGCGRETYQTKPEAPGFEPMSERSWAMLSGNQSCPLYFTKSNLCAAIAWNRKLEADSPADFEVRFWNKSRGTRSGGPFENPASSPSTVFIMKCCKSPFAFALQPTRKLGVYRGQDIKLSPGEYWHRLAIDGEVVSEDVVLK